jgi:AcrR family transcriptional regulator
MMKTMKHSPIRAIAAAPQPMTRRALAKQLTRAKLLEAAREMFADRGYEAATVRDIAAAANLSTGAVFASFADKADLFNEVIVVEYEFIHASMVAATDEAAPARETLLSLLTLAYDVYLTDIRLVQAALSFCWTRDLLSEPRHMAAVDLVRGHLAEVLQRGVDSGELSPALDVRLTSDMLWETHLSNYRRVIFDGWGREALRARMACQLDVLISERKIAA